MFIETQRSCKAEADRLEAGGFNLVIDSKNCELAALFYIGINADQCIEKWLQTLKNALAAQKPRLSETVQGHFGRFFAIFYELKMAKTHI